VRNAVSCDVARFYADWLCVSLTKYRTNYRLNNLSMNFSFFVMSWTFRPVPTLLRAAIFIFSYHFLMDDGLQVSGLFYLATFLPPFRLLTLSTPSGNFVLIDSSLPF
jgi:hypothetical protein